MNSIKVQNFIYNVFFSFLEKINFEFLHIVERERERVSLLIEFFVGAQACQSITALAKSLRPVNLLKVNNAVFSRHF